MSSSSGAARPRGNPRSGDPRKRSGDPRKHSAPATEPRPDRRRVGIVVAAVAVAVGVLALAFAATGPGTEAPDTAARRHVEAACDLAGKAGEAAEATTVDARSRYAASVLLLDRAIIESARAAESDPALVDLDTALQDVHTAGHERDAERWQAALDETFDQCRRVLG